MKIKLDNGELEINGKRVLTIIFEDLKQMTFPFGDSNKIEIDSTSRSNKTDITGNGNVVIQGKNIVNSNVMNIKGDFRLGDG